MFHNKLTKILVLITVIKYKDQYPTLFKFTSTIIL